MLLSRRRVHLHNSASFTILFEKITKMMLELFPKRSNNSFKNHPKHDSEKQWKISSKGRHRKGNQRSPKGAAMVPKAPPGPPWNSDGFYLFRSPAPRRPKVAKRDQKGSNKRRKRYPKEHLFDDLSMITSCFFNSHPSTPQKQNKAKQRRGHTFQHTHYTLRGGSKAE